MKLPLRLAALLTGAFAAAAASGGAPAQQETPAPVVRVDIASPYGQVRVIDYPSTGLRCLEFPPGTALQSCMRRSDPTELVFPYLRTMVAALAVQPSPRRVLVVGLGGGAITRYLQRYFPRVHQTVVEIDPEVVRVARQYFGLVTAYKTSLEVMDARTFLGRTREVFDVILLDAYGVDEIPHHLTTVEFFRLVRSRLKPDGVVAANIWGPGANALYERQVRTIQATFPFTYLFVAGGEAPSGAGGDVDAMKNRIVFATMRVSPTKDEWAARALTITRDNGLDFDLAALVRREYHDISDEPLDAEPLTDAQHH